MNYILFEHVKYALATNRIEATWDLKEILTFFYWLRGADTMIVFLRLLAMAKYVKNVLICLW